MTEKRGIGDALAGKLVSDRDYFNPLEWLVIHYPNAPHDHITFDACLKPQYRIRRGSRHDGTYLFTLENIANALQPLVDQTSYHRPSGPPDWSIVKEIHYIVGMGRIATVYGRVNLPSGCYPGQRECVTIPVCCQYLLWTGLPVHPKDCPHSDCQVPYGD